MSTDNFISIKPINKEIRKYISYYYFHSSDDDSFRKSIMYYPNYKCALTVYKNSELRFKPNHSFSFPSPKPGIKVFYTGIQNNARTSEIQAPFNKIGIVFHSLGINHFLKKNLNEVSSKTDDMNFDYFGKPFIEVCDNVYSRVRLEEKAEILDAYFIKNIQNFNKEKLFKAITLIHDDNQKQTVSSLAKELDINRRTLLRLFQKHVCCSVKDYINVVQFRNAIDQYLVGEADFESLTSLAHQHNFYDQSEFIKYVKKLTGDKPKTFFKNVKHLGSEDTFWNIK